MGQEHIPGCWTWFSRLSLRWSHYTCRGWAPSQVPGRLSSQSKRPVPGGLCGAGGAGVITGVWVLVCAHACTHMWVKMEIFGQKSLCSWKKTSCWVIPGYVLLDSVLLVLMLPHLNSTLANNAALQTQRLCQTQPFAACSTTPSI